MQLNTLVKVLNQNDYTINVVDVNNKYNMISLPTAIKKIDLSKITVVEVYIQSSYDDTPDCWINIVCRGLQKNLSALSF